MRNLLLRICCLLSLISAVSIATPQSAYASGASGDLSNRSKCKLNTPLIGWAGSAAMHPNGLLYAATTVSPYSSMYRSSSTAVFAINPETIQNDLCAIVETYTSSDTYAGMTVEVIPSVLASDSTGNLYFGKGSMEGFKLNYVPANAPASSPFTGIKTFTIPKPSDNFASTQLAATNDYVLVGGVGWTPGSGMTMYYTILDTDDIKNASVLTPNWKQFGIGPGTFDSVVGLANGQFFIANNVSFDSSSPIVIAFLNPVTGVLTNPFNLTSRQAGIVPCSAPGLAFSKIFSCISPSAIMGQDNNLYFSMHIQARGSAQTAKVVMRYDFATNTWKGLGSLTAKPTVINALNNLYTYGGAGMIADADGNVVIAANGIWNTKLTKVALLRNGVWSEGTANNSQASFGKPSINIITVGGEVRVSDIFTLQGANSNQSIHGTWLATWAAPLNAGGTLGTAKCSPNIVIEDGAPFVKSTSISGVIYTKENCDATRYLAVASASDTPPTSPNVSDIKTFSPANATFSVNGLSTGWNYVHVRLYDASSAIEKWVTNQVYVDTSITVGASIAISNGSRTPNYKDTWSMRGSSYTASGYTRSSIGMIRITGITDPSGLASYAINDQPAVAFDSNSINQPIPVNFDSITDTVGISLTLTDGAGNTEIRGIRPLTYDVAPPSISVDPTPTFTATTGVFSGTIGLTGGTITDDLYAASGRQYWGVWVANAKCVGDVVGGCPTATDSQLRWGAVPVSDPTSIPWNLLHGVNQAPSSGLYRTYIRVLDGAGNASTTAITVDTTVTMTTNKIYMPLNFSQR